MAAIFPPEERSDFVSSMELLNEIAWGAQARKQLPHPMHRSVTIDGSSLITSTLIALTGQIRTQE
jgi:hypothetical protein